MSIDPLLRPCFHGVTENAELRLLQRRISQHRLAVAALRHCMTQQVGAGSYAPDTTDFFA